MAGRWLFGLAAAFNAIVGLALLLFRPQTAAVLHLDPIAGTNLVLLYLTAGFILLFAAAFGMIALDPVRYRVFIPLSIVGKLSAVVCISAPWLAGRIPATLPMLGSGDLIFAALFLVYLIRTRRQALAR